MKLSRLLEAIEISDFSGDLQLEIEGLAYDSRKVRPGYLFVALRGHRLDGHDYVPDAVGRGCVALVGERFQGVGEGITRILVPDSRKALARLAQEFYGAPFEGVSLIGITGTNGKTTTSYILESILSAAGARPGVIGTINYRYSGAVHRAEVTTPESLDLMALLREMKDHGVTDVIIEVSSHALDQGRIGECAFKVAVFTNISRDHLDYHRDMEAYFKAKSLLFQRIGRGNPDDPNYAVVNLDDPRGRDLMNLTQAQTITYGLSGRSDVRAESIHWDEKGIRARIVTPLGARAIESPLIGEINVYNILASIATSMALGIDLDDMVRGIKKMNRVPGRMELVPNGLGLTIVVDYAHTPDALLKTIRNLRPLAEARFITVFGCGGDRDKGKRREMGRLAGLNSDILIITSDNPRTEDPLLIIEEIEKGVQEAGLGMVSPLQDTNSVSRGYLLEPDRREAIGKAVRLAEKGDLVLIAGKGHEDYQIVGTERRTFDDREEARKAAREGEALEKVMA
ncbi:MAG: UDP-N-acetylmuramoyl-L-alanyl-D-glutamate--2,6-diaminopimelate ligase [Deltaproteobacteria bacterium]|nr:UDP-N-acetylmuramoyl-L-alanyl-D-glutamate--2,6-diaminopimelate ligase [Deltaproteobacteria bacterium]MBW2136578.1 UDP-N-acetylmuramoyl-L-alanyl-D-glutamate--2,6-diaminopimelate ligase [Deltaproteobacteria bacterium]